MLPLTYEPGAGHPRRLHATGPRGHASGFSVKGGLLFGGAFVAIGAWILLVGLRLVEPGGTFNMPRQLLVPIGAVFASAGVFVWNTVRRQHAAERHHEQVRLLHPDEPALADHPWNPAGAPSRLRAHAARATLIALFFILFLTPFNYVVFLGNEAPLFAKIIVGVFDAVTLYLIYDAALRWARAFKFGQAFLRYDTFPFSTRAPVKLAWITPEGCKGDATGSFTLRAVREWRETSHRGNSRETRLVHEQQWSGSWKITVPTRIVPGQVCELVFELPPDAPSTALHAEQPLFWELVANLQLPGLDFKETYLVPIYGPKRA